MTAYREQAEKKRRRRPLRDVLLACIVVLLLAQGLIGSLSLSALNRLAADNTAERIELLARRTSYQIQTGMTLGKPLAQYFGLSSFLDELRSQVPDFAPVGVVLSHGTELASVGPLPDAGSLIPDLLAPHSGGFEGFSSLSGS